MLFTEYYTAVQECAVLYYLFASGLRARLRGSALCPHRVATSPQCSIAPAAPSGRVGGRVGELELRAPESRTARETRRRGGERELRGGRRLVSHRSRVTWRSDATRSPGDST